MSWGLSKAPGKFQGPRDAQGASWGLSEAPGAQGCSQSKLGAF